MLRVRQYRRTRWNRPVLCWNYEAYVMDSWRNFFIVTSAKLRKPTISFVMSVRPSMCLSVRMEQLGSNWANFHGILYLRIFRKFQVPLKSDKNNGYCTWRPRCTFIKIARLILLTVRNVWDRSCRENQTTHFMFSKLFSPKIMQFVR